MKKYIIAAMTALVIMIAGLSLCSVHKRKHYYDREEVHWPKSVLLKDTTVWLYDSACYKEEGIFKRVYRKYNYEYYDSTVTVESPGNNLEIECAKTHRGDIVFMQYRDVTNFPRRED